MISREMSSEANQSSDAGPLIARSLARQLRNDELETIITAQRECLSRFEKTNEMLTNCNTLSSARFATAVKELQPYRQMLVEMKRDLDAIFRRIRTYKQAFSQTYPEAFAAAQEAVSRPSSENENCTDNKTDGDPPIK